MGFYEGAAPPNAWEGEKKYGPMKPKIKKYYKPIKKKPKLKTPPKRYYA
jgi:hypothetical protein